MFILEGTSGDSAGSPSCPWLCCNPSYSCTILQRAVEVTEGTFTPFKVFWLLLSWISSFWILESGDFRLHLDIVFMECLRETLLSSIQFPWVCQGLLPPPQLCAPARTCRAAPRFHSRDRAWGMWHTPQLSKDQMVCLFACKERAKKKKNPSISQQFMQQSLSWWSFRDRESSFPLLQP